jgi:hypothetical protein
MLVFSPLLAAVGTTVVNNTTATIKPQAWDSDVGIANGDTLFYTLNQLSLPGDLTSSMTGFTLPDFAGSTLFVKILYIDEDYYFTPEGIGIPGTLVHYAMGLIFNNDLTFTIGEGITSTNIVLPAGSGTPGVQMAGVPHFNGSSYGPALFFLNDDWAHHESLLEYMGFTVTDGVDTFHAEQSDASGSVSGDWRKSDGICTHMLIDNIEFGDANFTDVTFEFTLDRVEHNPLPVTPGENIEFGLDILDISVGGDMINETTLSLIDEEIADVKAAYEGKTLMKMVVTEVRGVYYMCDTYIYDNWTDQMIKGEYPTVFNGFVGSLGGYVPFFGGVIATPGFYYPEGPSYNYFSGPGPFVTPDWEIYGAYMKTYDTLLSVYAVDIIDLMTMPTDEIVINAIGGQLELVNRKDFYYFHEILSVNIDSNLTYSTVVDPFMPEMVYDTNGAYEVDQEGYVCYHESGVGAVIRLQVDFTVTVTDTYSIFDEGTLTVNANVKLRNPDYDPPELMSGGIIPGYTWIIAIPALLSLAALGIIRRKRQ